MSPTVRQNKAFASWLLPKFPLNATIEWIKCYIKPEDVFDEEQLANWAENNGYVREDK